MQQEVRQLTSTDLRVTTADKQDSFGAIGQTADDRLFRYCQIGASNVPSGTVLSSPATGANFLSLSVSAAAPIGSTVVNLTLAGTATTMDQFSEGNLDTLSGTGAGVSYKIKGNSYQSSTTGVVQIALVEPLVVALDTTSKVNVSPNQWSLLTSQVSLGSSADNPKIVGATSLPLNANQYGWIQSEGRCMLLNDGAGILYRGLTCVLSTATAGRIQLTNATSDADKQIVGNILEHSIATAGLLTPVYLTIF